MGLGAECWGWLGWEPHDVNILDREEAIECNSSELVRQIGFSQGFHPTATFLGGLGDESPNVTQPPYSAISHSAPLNPEQL